MIRARLALCVLATLVSGPLSEHHLVSQEARHAGDRGFDGAIATARAVLQRLMTESDLPGLSVAFTTRPRDEILEGTLTGSARTPGWMTWEGTTPLVLAALDTLHADHTRIVGAGRQGLLNLWVSFSYEAFEGRWDWLGRTVDIHASRR